MESVIVIVIIVVVVLGLAGIVLSPIMASKDGGKMGSAFSQAYRQEFGTAPPPAAESAIAGGTTIILSAMGTGQYAYPSENLRKRINEYGSAVAWNESKMELGLGCLLAVCCNKDMKPAPGCQWAIDVITDSMATYCPSMMRRAFGY